MFGEGEDGENDLDDRGGGGDCAGLGEGGEGDYGEDCGLDAEGED